MITIGSLFSGIGGRRQEGGRAGQAGGEVSSGLLADGQRPASAGSRREVVSAAVPSDATRKRLSTSKVAGRPQQKLAVALGDGWGAPPPAIRRVAHGFPPKLDKHRIIALGNAVVPQCAATVGVVIIQLGLLGGAS